MNLNASDVKTFVPSNDFAESLRFYEAFGWKRLFVAEDSSLAILELADCRFYLQNYYQKQWAENFMLHIVVEDAAAWHQHVTQVIETEGFKKARVNTPKEEPYGATVTHVWDPTGVLLHFAQFHETSDD